MRISHVNLCAFTQIRFEKTWTKEQAQFIHTTLKEQTLPAAGASWNKGEVISKLELFSKNLPVKIKAVDLYENWIKQHDSWVCPHPQNPGCISNTTDWEEATILYKICNLKVVTWESSLQLRAPQRWSFLQKILDVWKSLKATVGLSLVDKEIFSPLQLRSSHCFPNLKPTPERQNCNSSRAAAPSIFNTLWQSRCIPDVRESSKLPSAKKISVMVSSDTPNPKFK